MPFNGSGVFSLVYDWTNEQASSPIEISKLDEQEADIAAGLSNCILRDGTGVPTQHTPWNNKKITGLADAAAATDAMNRQSGDARYVLQGPAALSVITAAEITAQQDDYSPTGLASAAIVRLTSDTNGRAITGLAGGAAGRVIMLMNANGAGGAYITFTSESASSTAANRFGFSSFDLGGGQVLTLVYDSTSSRWRAVGGPV